MKNIVVRMFFFNLNYTNKNVKFEQKHVELDLVFWGNRFSTEKLKFTRTIVHIDFLVEIEQILVKVDWPRCLGNVLRS